MIYFEIGDVLGDEIGKIENQNPASRVTEIVLFVIRDWEYLQILDYFFYLCRTVLLLIVFIR